MFAAATLWHLYNNYNLNFDVCSLPRNVLQIVSAWRRIFLYYFISPFHCIAKLEKHCNSNMIFGF